MTAAASYRVAIIGAGAVADHHARALADIEHATLVAAARRSEAPGRAFAERHGCTWYDDYETLLDEATPDVVTVATPSGAHRDPSMAAMKRGIHVLCEKPLEITTERIDRMIEAADRNEVQLGGIFQSRYGAPVRAVRQAVADGRFDGLAVASAAVPWWRDDAYYEGTWKGTQRLDGGGALMNQSIHAIDALQWIVAADMDLAPADHPVAEVYAYTGVRGHDPADIEVEDTAVAVLRFRNGVLGHVLGTTAAFPGSERRLRVAGRGGTAELEGDGLVQWRFRAEEPADEQTRQTLGKAPSGSGASDPMAIDYAGHTRNIRAFLDSLAGAGAYDLDGREARKAVATIEAIYASARTGAPVEPA